MKAFYRKTIASCLSMIVLFLTIGPAAAANVTSAIEIRGPVYNGSDIDDIIDTYGDGTTLTVDATNFAAFFYNIDDNVTTETLSIKDVTGTSDNRLITEELRYYPYVEKTAGNVTT